MREDELIVLMKKSGFSSRDIKKVRELSMINITTMVNALYVLSSMYFKLIKVHVVVVIVACLFFIIGYIDHNGISYENLSSLAITFVPGHLAARQVGPLRLAFKARRMLKTLQKNSKTHH